MQEQYCTCLSSIPFQNIIYEFIIEQVDGGCC